MRISLSQIIQGSKVLIHSINKIVNHRLMEWKVERERQEQRFSPKRIKIFLDLSMINNIP